MARTTPELIAEIIEWDDFFPLEPFITAANFLVEKLLTPAKKSNGDLWYTDGDLELIETWLSAHFYAIQDPRVVQETIGGAIQTQFESRVGLGLDITRYGQQVKILDISGILAQHDMLIKKGKRPRVSIKWMGKERE